MLVKLNVSKYRKLYWKSCQLVNCLVHRICDTGSFGCPERISYFVACPAKIMFVPVPVNVATPPILAEKATAISNALLNCFWSSCLEERHTTKHIFNIFECWKTLMCYLKKLDDLWIIYIRACQNLTRLRSTHLGVSGVAISATILTATISWDNIKI